MKQFLHITMVQVCLVLVAIFSLYSCCCHKPVCKGYTGTLTDSSSIALSNRDHFIIKDSIINWTARYQANKALIKNDSLPPAGDILGDSSSFNSCFIKALLCHDSCIGLRVLYGMDTAKKVHAIIVGINPDYSTLYIYKPTHCVPPPLVMSRKTVDTANAAESMMWGGTPGGIEFGQRP